MLAIRVRVSRKVLANLANHPVFPEPTGASTLRDPVRIDRLVHA
jgi:hypothetical protein